MGTKERLGCFYKKYLAEYSDPHRPKIRDLVRKRGYREFANGTSHNANQTNGMKQKIKWGQQSNSSGRRLYSVHILEFNCLFRYTMGGIFNNR